MIILLIYFFISMFMMAMVYLRILGIFLDYREEHPNVRVKKISAPTMAVNIIVMFLIFLCPIANFAAFLILVIAISENEIIDKIKEKTYLE